MFNNKVNRHIIYLTKKDCTTLFISLSKSDEKYYEANHIVLFFVVTFFICIFESTTLSRKYHVRENKNHKFINSIFIFVSGGMFPFQYFSAYDVLLDLETRNKTIDKRNFIKKRGGVVKFDAPPIKDTSLVFTCTTPPVWSWPNVISATK